MTDDAVDDFGVGENRDDFHFRTTFVAQEWVHLEDFWMSRAQEARLGDKGLSKSGSGGAGTATPV